VKRLLEEKNNDINLQNDRGWTVLMHAARGTGNNMEDLEIVNLILKYKPNVNIQSHSQWGPSGQSALMSSVEYWGSAAIINSLLEVDEIKITHSPNEKHQKQALEKVKRLLKDKNIDVNLQNFDGDTPLMVAVEENNLDMVNALLQHPQINVNLRNNEGLTAFMIAMEKTQFKWNMTNNTPIVKRLLEVGGFKGNLKNFRIGLLQILEKLESM
jgi:ankyrin repeat protein